MSPSVASSFSKALADFAPDLVHVHAVKYHPRIVSITRRHAPLVWGVHDYSSTCPSGNLYFRPGRECGKAHGPACIPAAMLGGCWHSADLRSLPRRYRDSARSVAILREVDLALSFSSFMRRHLETNDISSSVVPPFTTGRIGMRGGATDDHILFVGRLSSNKGLGQLIRAMRDIDGTLEVCGEGWWEPTARKLAAKLGIADRVRFLGWLGPTELDAAYERAAVVAVPSLWPEPFGVVGIEAMARGRPVVASRTGGIPDWLVDGVTGVLTRPGDVGELAAALRRLIESPELRARMGAAAVDRVRRHFTVEVHLAALERVHTLARERWLRSGKAAA